MSKNFATRLVSPNGLYNASYTSEVLNTGFGVGQGVVQVDLAGATSITIQGRMSEEAPWFTLKIFTAAAIEQLALPFFIRAVSVGGGQAWVGGAV
jgi:hypothetical protein